MQNEELRDLNKQKAAEVLLESMLVNGIVATTKEVVSRQSGLSLSSMARYFPTKDSMVMAAICEIGRQNTNSYEAICTVNHGTGAERLSEFYDYALTRYLENPNVCALCAEIICYARYAQAKNLSNMLKDMGYLKQLLTIFQRGMEDKTIHCEWSVEEEAQYASSLLFVDVSYVANGYDLAIPEEKNRAETVLRRLFARACERYMVA